jgi:hypothetical protein
VFHLIFGVSRHGVFLNSMHCSNTLSRREKGVFV